MDHSTVKRLKEFIRATDQIPKLTTEDLNADILIHHTVKLDVNKILDDNPDVAESILDDPDLGEHELRQVIQDELWRIHQKHFKICVTVEWTSLPPGFNGGTVKRLVELPAISNPSMPFLFPAQLVGKSRKFMHTMTSRFRCENSLCAAHQKNHVEDIPFPEKFKSSELKCFFCQSLLYEIPEARQISYYVIADFKPILEDGGNNFASFKVIDNLDYLALGEYYRIIGKAIGSQAFYKCIHLSPMEETMPKFLGMKVELHPELYGLIAKSSECPWSFVNGLACHLGSHITPSGTFHQLKLALLLSLAVSKVDPEAPSQLPLLVALLDSSELPIKLLHYALTLLEDERKKRPIIHSESSTLASHVIKKEGKVTAGSLLMAKDTLCFLGELTKYKKDALDTIKSVLESGHVIVRSPDVEGNSHESYPLMATIWTYCSKASKIKMKDFCNGLKPFIDVFGTMFVCREADRDTPALVEHLLSMHTRGCDLATINQGFHQALKMLLRQVRDRHLVMDPEASLLLKKYFVASRRARANDGLKGGSTDMPLNALKTMTTMAEGHARLSLRESKVSIFDALAAIKLYEENMTHCSSSGWTSFVLEPTLTQLSNGHEKINEEMLVFWARLEDFINHFVGDLSVSINVDPEAEE